MSGYLSQIRAEAHAADLGEQARRARSGRTGHRPPPFRNATARLLLELAMRLDHGLRPIPIRPSTSAPRT